MIGNKKYYYVMTMEGENGEQRNFVIEIDNNIPNDTAYKVSDNVEAGEDYIVTGEDHIEAGEDNIKAGEDNMEAGEDYSGDNAEPEDPRETLLNMLKEAEPGFGQQRGEDFSDPGGTIEKIESIR